MWEGVGDRTELQHIDFHSYGHQCFFSILLGCSTRGLRAQPLWVLFFSTASYLQLSDLQTPWSGVPRAPSAGCCFLFSIISPTLGSPNSLNFLCTELYNSSMPTQSLPITGHWNMHFRRLWNGMFGQVGGQYTTPLNKRNQTKKYMILLYNMTRKKTTMNEGTNDHNENEGIGAILLYKNK